MRTTALFASLACLASCQTTPGPMDNLLTQHAQALGQIRQIAAGLDLQCSPAEAEVAVDGVLQGTCADVEGRLVPLGEGRHRIEVKGVGFRPYAVELAAGNARTRLEVELVPSG